MCISLNFACLSVAHRHTKPLVIPRLPVLLLTRLAAIEGNLATRAGSEQQVRAVAAADTAVGALSLVACAGLADTSGDTGSIRARWRVCEKGDDMVMATMRRNIKKSI